MPLVLLADDDDDIRSALKEVLDEAGFEIYEAKNGLDVADILYHCKIKGSAPDCIVADYRMPHFTGLDLVAALRKMSWEIPVVLITAFGPDVIDQALASGAFEVVTKPFDMDHLIEVIQRACK